MILQSNSNSNSNSTIDSDRSEIHSFCSFISSECTYNLISSLNTTTSNSVLGLDMEHFREQITAMYLKNN